MQLSAGTNTSETTNGGYNANAQRKLGQQKTLKYIATNTSKLTLVAFMCAVKSAHLVHCGGKAEVVDCLYKEA